MVKNPPDPPPDFERQAEGDMGFERGFTGFVIEPAYQGLIGPEGLDNVPETRTKIHGRYLVP
jgi:hypothetical protein